MLEGAGLEGAGLGGAGSSESASDESESEGAASEEEGTLMSSISNLLICVCRGRQGG